MYKFVRLGLVPESSASFTGNAAADAMDVVDDELDTEEEADEGLFDAVGEMYDTFLLSGGAEDRFNEEEDEEGVNFRFWLGVLILRKQLKRIKNVAYFRVWFSDL